MRKILLINELLDYLFGTLFIEDLKESEEVNLPNDIVRTSLGLIRYLEEHGSYVFQPTKSTLKKLSISEEKNVLLENCSLFTKVHKSKTIVKWEPEAEMDFQTAFQEYAQFCPPLDLESVRIVQEGKKTVYKTKALTPEQLRGPKKPPVPEIPHRPKRSFAFSPTAAPSIHKTRGMP